MRFVIFPIGVFLAFVAGYLSEPGLRDFLLETRAATETELPAGELQPTGELEPKDDSSALSDDAPAPDPAVDPNPEPDNELAHAPEPVEEKKEFVRLTNDQIREIMTESLARGEIRHFTADQVIEWKSFGEMEIDGERYHYGVVDYSEQTSYGERFFEAKALLRFDTVEQWIWPRSGARIE